MVFRGVSIGGNSGRARIGVALALTFLLSACTNNLFRAGGTRGLASNGVPALPPNAGASATALNLIRVVRDDINPGTVLDLIDDGSGAMGAACLATGSGGSTTTTTSSSGTSGNTGPSTCACTYTYTSTSGTTMSYDVPTLYHENDMIRCDYSSVPAGLSSMQVSVHVTTTNAYSNSYTFNFTGTGVVLDPTNPATFLQALRYQCRDIVSIPYLFGGNLYDPFQSEDPKLSYPLDFYTTNMGSALSIFAAGFGSIPAPTSWYCPAIPNDPGFGTELNIYSVGPDSAGSRMIYPATGSAFDRSTFYLAKEPAGVFTVPLNAMLTPSIVTAEGGSNPPPIGYGASPIPTGYQQETCPDTSNIPPGFKWVKVWLFRADLPTRKYLVSSKLSAIGSVNCNNGSKWKDGSVVFPDCSTVDKVPGLGGAPGVLADRVIEDGVCINFNSPTGTNPPGPPFIDCTTVGGGKAPGCGGYQAATGWPGIDGTPIDVWELKTGTSGIVGVTGNLTKCGSSATGNYGGQDPLNYCSGVGPAGPYDWAPGTQNLDVTSGGTLQARMDFLFVVSPPTIMTSDMGTGVNSAGTSAGDPYRPLRFMTGDVKTQFGEYKGDCPSQNPDLCYQQNPSRMITYGIKYHDVGTNGDPPATDPSRAGVFPICALQPM